MKRLLILVGLAAMALLPSCKKDNNTQSNQQPPAVVPPKLSITSFSPQSAQPNAQITVTGTGFGNDLSVVQVAVGSSPYNPPVSVSPTAIVIQTNMATPSGKISIIVNGVTVTSTSSFTALPPDVEVSGYNQAGQLGHELYVSGQGFGTDTNKISVSFGGSTAVKANYIASDGLSIGATVPRYAVAGKITVTVNGKSATCSELFGFTMSIRDYSPKTFHVGDTVKVTGVSFTNNSDMSVEFNDFKATKPTSVTPTQLLVIAPSTAQSGYLTVTAGLGTTTDFTLDKFTVLP